jgi:TolA-binding protein
MRITRAPLAFLVLSLAASGCLKSRSELRRESENPDSGYSTEVKEVSAQDKNQQVVEELRGEINQMTSRIDELQKRNEELARQNEKNAQREQQLRDMDAKLQELQAQQAALIDALQKKEQERQERLKQAEKEKEVPKAEPTDVFAEGRSQFK